MAFILDDILLFPIKGLLRIFREIQNAAEQELLGQSEKLTEQLSELYMMLETGQISEKEFEEQEKEILDRLDALEQLGAQVDDAEEGDQEEEETEDEDIEDDEEDIEDEGEGEDEDDEGEDDEGEDEDDGGDDEDIEEEGDDEDEEEEA